MSWRGRGGPGDGAPVGGGGELVSSGFPVFSFFFLFFSMLHHAEPNRAMLVGVGGGGGGSYCICQLVPQRKRVLFCNYKITKDTVLTGFGRALESQYGQQSCISPQPTVLLLVPGHYFCPDLVASLHNANHGLLFFVFF